MNFKIPKIKQVGTMMQKSQLIQWLQSKPYPANYIFQKYPSSDDSDYNRIISLFHSKPFL